MPSSTRSRIALPGSVLLLLAAIGASEAHGRAAVTTPATTPATERGAGQDTLRFTAQELALGERVYHGRAGGALCSVCHGAAGRGTARGPSLADSTWLHVDGSYASIVGIVADGVAEARVHVTGMLPGGGALLSDEQVRAVAAYVYVLSHPQARGGAP